LTDLIEKFIRKKIFQKLSEINKISGDFSKGQNKTET